MDPFFKLCCSANVNRSDCECPTVAPLLDTPSDGNGNARKRKVDERKAQIYVHVEQPMHVNGEKIDEVGCFCYTGGQFIMKYLATMTFFL